MAVDLSNPLETSLIWSAELGAWIASKAYSAPDPKSTLGSPAPNPANGQHPDDNSLAGQLGVGLTADAIGDAIRNDEEGAVVVINGVNTTVSNLVNLGIVVIVGGVVFAGIAFVAWHEL